MSLVIRTWELICLLRYHIIASVTIHLPVIGVNVQKIFCLFQFLYILFNTLAQEQLIQISRLMIMLDWAEHVARRESKL